MGCNYLINFFHFIFLKVKPVTALHLEDKPTVKNKLSIIENTSITLFCNSTAMPNVITYEWYFNEQRLGNQINSKTLRLVNLKRDQSGNYSCKCSNKHGHSQSVFNIEIICKFCCYFNNYFVCLFFF